MTLCPYHRTVSSEPPSHQPLLLSPAPAQRAVWPSRQTFEPKVSVQCSARTAFGSERPALSSSALGQLREVPPALSDSVPFRIPVSRALPSPQ